MRVGILCTNTPAFLEAIFGIAAASAVNVGKLCLSGDLRRRLYNTAEPDRRL